METNAKDTAILGSMFFFQYDAKGKATLPVWDKFPLVFPIERYPDGVLGLNMHYLQSYNRSAIIKALLKLKSDTAFNMNTRLRITYDILKNSQTLAGPMNPCIKRYLFNHVRSRFIMVHPTEWEYVIDLPVASFVYNKGH